MHPHKIDQSCSDLCACVGSLECKPVEGSSETSNTKQCRKIETIFDWRSKLNKGGKSQDGPRKRTRRIGTFGRVVFV